MAQALLAAMLQYQNPDVISRFTDKYAVTEAEARDIFQETKKFLYLTTLEKVNIYDDMLIIDEMWHNFVLFTIDYAQFCEQYFGKFKHHVPATKAEKEAVARLAEQNPEKARQDFLDAYERLVSLTYDHLGEETALKWFTHYPELYSPEKIKALYK